LTNGPALSSIVYNEPPAASPDAIATTDERLERLIADDKSDQEIKDFESTEVASKMAQIKKQKNKLSSSSLQAAVNHLKNDLEHADQFISHVELMIRAKKSSAGGKKKLKASPQVSLADIVESENIPQIVL